MKKILHTLFHTPILLVLSIFLLGIPEVSHADACLETYIDLLRSDIKAKKADILHDALELNKKESEIFWAIYKDYEWEMEGLWEKRLAVKKKILENKLQPRTLKELEGKWFTIQESRIKLWRKYYQKYSKALPPAKAATWLLTEYELNLLMDVKTQCELPQVTK